MKVMLNLLIVISTCMFAGCTATKPQPKPFTLTRGIAHQALDIESAEWDREQARLMLDALLVKITSSVTASRHNIDSPKVLSIIHRSIKKTGFSVSSNGNKTFGDALITRTLDCSDLTLIYIEVLGRFGITACPVYSRNHVFIVLLKENENLCWETTTGKKISLLRIIEEQKIPHESVENQVYLAPQAQETILANVYLAMGLKMSDEQKQKEKAEELLRKSIVCHPTMVNGIQSLAAFLCGQERFQEAEPLLQKAITLDPNNYSLYDFAAALYESMGEKEKAVEMCKKAFVWGTDSEATMEIYFRISIGQLFEALSLQQ